MRRWASTVLAVCLLASVAGCKSNNADGRLVGTWDCTEGPLLTAGLTRTWFFAADGSWGMEVRTTGSTKTITGQYHAGVGDAVTIDHLSEPINGKDVVMDNITVNGDQMTVRDPDGTKATFTKRAPSP